MASLQVNGGWGWMTGQIDQEDGGPVRYEFFSAHSGSATGLPSVLGGLSLLELPAIPASCHLNEDTDYLS